MSEEYTNTENIDKLRSETIARLEKRGWKDAVRIFKKFDDPIDIRAAYEWSEHIDSMLEAGYIQAILD
jgi:hypothetical protein